MKTVVVVPVRDEADALERLLPRVGAQAGGATVVVVDDGSSDGSAEVARRHGVAVIGQRPLGKPAAVRCGFEYALAQDCDAAVVFDGDGQHPPEALPDMIGLLRSSDIVKGARFHPASPQIGTPDDRQELCRRIRDLVREHTGWVVHDPQCGFVGLRRPMIELEPVLDGRVGDRADRLAAQPDGQWVPHFGAAHPGYLRRPARPQTGGQVRPRFQQGPPSGTLPAPGAGGGGGRGPLSPTPDSGGASLALLRVLTPF